MKAKYRDVLYVGTAVVMVALVATIYLGIVNPSQLIQSIRDAFAVLGAVLGGVSGVLAHKNLTPDPTEEAKQDEADARIKAANAGL